MAITIDWPNRIINVPKADLTLVTAPNLYELDLDLFRLTLKDLEDDETGITFERTHNHNSEVTVAGVTLARVIEIINGYTVTFEDGQYAVNLVGANSNLAEVTNINQVSIRSFNTAGLITVGGASPTAVADAVWDTNRSGHTTAGTFGEAAHKAALLSDDWADGGRLDLILDDILSKIDTEVASVLAAVDTEVGAIKAKTDLIPAAPASETTLTSLTAIATWLREVQEGKKTHVLEGSTYYFEVRRKTDNVLLLRHREYNLTMGEAILPTSGPVHVGGNLA